MRRIVHVFIFSIVLLVLLNSTVSSEVKLNTQNFIVNSLPYWITDTYSYPIQPAFIAFTHNRMYDRNWQKENAILDIAAQASIYKSVDLKYQYIVSDNYLIAENEFNNEYFDYFYDVDEAYAIVPNIKILESYETKDGWFYLGHDPNITSFSYDLVQNTVDRVPEWTGIRNGNIPLLEGYLLGVNNYPHYSKKSLVKLIESADHSAFMQIIYQTEIQTRTYQEEEVRTRSAHVDTRTNDSATMRHTSSVMMHGLHVIGRYIDEKNSRIYSLVVAPENTYTLKEWE